MKVVLAFRFISAFAILLMAEATTLACATSAPPSSTSCAASYSAGLKELKAAKIKAGPSITFVNPDAAVAASDAAARNFHVATETMCQEPLRTSAINELAQTYQLRGVAYLQLGRLSESQSSFAMSVRTNVSYPNERRRIDALLRQHRWGEAFRRLKQLTAPKTPFQSSPISALLWDSGAASKIIAGLDWSASGNFPQAQQMFKEASRLSPSAQEPHYFLGITALALGDPQNARAELLRALKAYDPSPEATAYLTVYSVSSMSLLQAIPV